MPLYAPSQRQLRFGEMVRHALAEMLLRDEVSDPAYDLRMITIPEVRMSPDLKVATAYILPLGGRDPKPALAALERNAKFARGVLARKIKTKFMPDLRFRFDDSFDKAQRLDAILHSPAVRRDVEGLPDKDMP